MLTAQRLLELVYAQRDAVPVTQAVITFDAGTASDVADALGTEGMALAHSETLEFKLTLDKPEDRANLLAMTPHGWRASAERRAAVIEQAEPFETIVSMREELIHSLVARRVPEKAYAEQWELVELAHQAAQILLMMRAEDEVPSDFQVRVFCVLCFFIPI